MRYKYSEEIRASLGPGVYNRDPVVGYHLVNIDGMIQSLRLSIATKFGNRVKLGMSFESLYDDALSYEYGVNVIDKDDALASDSTKILNHSLTINNVVRPAFGAVIE